MNAFELISRLEQLDDLVIPRFVLVQDREFIGYTIDSVTDDGTLVVVPSGKIDVLDSTDGAVSGDSDWHGSVVHEVQDDHEEDERPGD